MGGQDTKVKVRDRILIAMKEHLPMDVLAILETVLAKEFAAVSMEEVNLLPVDVRNSVEEQHIHFFLVTIATIWTFPN